MSENADHVAGCEGTQNPEFLPPDLCGLDPLFHAFNRMYIKDILSMSEYPTLPGELFLNFIYFNHFIPSQVIKPVRYKGLLTGEGNGGK